ncbi:MAG: GPW/gp25 family protein [Kouleothrix sp.]|nr:GPW/gp25 family protein [Kouleothrix sp.]
MQIDFPFRFDGRGRSGLTDENNHIRDMIEQFLFTAPKQRVNRPDFGSGLLELVFAPNSPELAAALEFTIQAGLQRWLGDLIDLRLVQVEADFATLRVLVTYLVRRTGEVRTNEFERRDSRWAT